MPRREMIKALKGKDLYLDIDGTLAEYRFNGHVSANDDTINGMTMEEIKDHVFLHSRPLKSVIKTIKKAEPHRIYILGALVSPIELVDKISWLKDNCQDIKFDSMYWYVSEEYWKDFLDYFDNCNIEYSNYLVDGSIINTDFGRIYLGNKNRFWDIMKESCRELLQHSVFIDDVLPYIKYAENIGVTCYHISSFIK